MTIALSSYETPVPGPSSWLPGGNFLKFRRNPPGFFAQTQRTYGDIARFGFGPQKVFLVGHPTGSTTCS